MKGSINLGKILGIKVLIHYTFLLLFVAIGYYVYDKSHNIQEVLDVFLIVLISFVCVLMHEYGHALAARKIGIQTRQIMILPIGGMAQLTNMPEKPKDELFVTICGPLVNVGIVLALLPFSFINGVMPTLLQLFRDGAGYNFISAFIANNLLLTVIFLNVGLFVFNLIPAYPMDGGRIFRALLAYRFKYLNATLIAARTGQIIASAYFIFILFSFVLERNETPHQKQTALQEQTDNQSPKADDDKLTYFGLLRMLLLCGFIVSLAEMEYRMVKRKDQMGGYEVPGNPIPDHADLNTDHSLGDAMNRIARNPHRKLPIMNMGHITGQITTELNEEYRHNRQIPNSTHRFYPGDSLGHALKMMEILGMPVLDLGDMFGLTQNGDENMGYYLVRQ